MIPPEVRQRLLATYAVLATLPPALLDDLLREASYHQLPRGALLFDEHHPCQAFPMVVQGSVRVVKATPSGRELRLYRVTPGESCILSSGCLLGGSPYPARGVAESDLTLVTLPAAAFRQLLDQQPQFRQYLFSLFSERLAELMQLVEEVAFRRLDARLATLLLAKGPHIHATHQALADELGSVREIISRLLRAFAEQGLVRLAREQIEVLDTEALRRIVRA